MITLTPAYGRSYSTAKAALADFAAGKDFILNDVSSRYDGKPINKADCRGEKVTLRFNYNRSTTQVES